MRFITAFSRHRIERQQYCLSTWQEHASEIIAVQTAEDISILFPHFPGVRFVETTLTGEELYQLPNRVRIKALVDQGPGLLINSDIKITNTPQEFKEDWASVPKQFNVGIRYDFDEPHTSKKINGYGIDAFLITEEVKNILPDVGFVIGVSVWDYWIIWHMLGEDFKIKSKTTPGLYHRRHPVNWSQKETDIGLKIMEQYYSLKNAKTILNIVIPIVTGRKRCIPTVNTKT
jgi:hypothetical protein